MKTLFLGTSAFAVPSLRVLAARTQLAGVLTQPDRPAGRGMRLRSSAVKQTALELGVPVYEPTQLRAFAAQMRNERFDLLALAAYGRILPVEVLELPRLGALNVHPSLLPKYRGASPIQSALLHGDDRTGVSIMLMDRGLDTGDVVVQKSVPIEPEETYGELHDRLAATGAELLSQALDLAAENRLVGKPQVGEPTLTRPLSKDDLTIDLHWPPKRIVDHVRAFSPQPAARATIDGEPVKILRAHVTTAGELAIDELIAPSRGRMSGNEYFRRSRS